MARLPSQFDLQRRIPRASTPSVRVPSVDYSGIARGAAAANKGLQSLGAAMQAADDEIDDYETRRRLLDFKLTAESAYEEHLRGMPAGGEGHTASWQATYQRLAREFVGKEDELIPQSQRGKIGLQLKSVDTMLAERAMRNEYKERDRRTIENLSGTLTNAKAKVEADPSARDAMLEEGRKIIDLADLQPAAKSRLHKEYGKEVDKTAVISRILRAETGADFAKLKEELGPDIADKRLHGDLTKRITSGTARGSAAGWARTNSTWQALGPFERAAVMALMEADGANPMDARNALSAMINRAAKLNEDLGHHVSRQIYQPTIEPTQEARLERLLRTPAFAEMVEWGKRRAAGAEQDPVNGATHFLAHEKVMLALESQNPRKYRSWRSWTGFDPATGEYRGVMTRDKSHAFLAPEGAADLGSAEGGEGYGGPYRNLSFADRRTLWGQAETQRRKLVADADKLVRSVSEVASTGMLLPDDQMAVITKRVSDLGEPVLSAKLAQAMAMADVTRSVQTLRPIDIAAMSEERRAFAEQNGMTPELKAHIEHLDKLQESVRTNINKDPLTWASRARIEVQAGTPDAPVRMSAKPERLDLTKPDFVDQLKRRAELADGVARYYGQRPQYFTAPEREVLSQVIERGGKPMIDLMGKLYQGFGGGILGAVQEIAGKNPEAAKVGYLMATGGAPEAIKDIAATIERRRDPNYANTPKPRLPDTAMTEMEGIVGQALRRQPAAERDGVYKAAYAIYENRMIGKDLKAGDIDVWKQAVQEVMGQRQDGAGNLYGGAVRTHMGWFSGNNDVVVIPSNLRKDKFRDVLRSITAEDLDAAGLQRPRDRSGKEVSLATVMSGRFVQIGPGRYMVAMGDPDALGAEGWIMAGGPMADPGSARAAQDDSIPNNTERFVLDLDRLSPTLKRRMPSAFLME